MGRDLRERGDAGKGVGRVFELLGVHVHVVGCGIASSTHVSPYELKRCKFAQGCMKSYSRHSESKIGVNLLWAKVMPSSYNDLY